MTTIETRCPLCQALFSVPEAQANKWVRCANCQGTFQVRPAAAAPAPLPEPSPAPAEEPHSPAESPWPAEPPRPRPARYTGRSEGAGKGAGAGVVVLIMIVLCGLRGCVALSPRHSSPSPSSYNTKTFQDLLDAQQRREDQPKDLNAFILETLKARKQIDMDKLRAAGLANQLKDPEQAEEAGRQLAKIKPDASVPVLVKALDSPHRKVRAASLTALEQLHAPQSAPAVARLLPSDDHEQASRVLQAIGKQAEPHVRPLLKESSSDVRARACWVLEKIGTDDSLPELRLCLKDGSRDVRDAARAAIEAIENEKPD
jgi:predicted Zn finger-like uncharacterized protein